MFSINSGMRTATVVVMVGASTAFLCAQEKPVPKDSVRVSVPGCTKGYVFTAGRRTLDEPGSVDMPEGMHLRMNGPKKLMAEIKAHEGSMIVITGLVRKGQYNEGASLGGGVRFVPGSAGGGIPGPTAGQIQIDVESWRPILGSCRS